MPWPPTIGGQARRSAHVYHVMLILFEPVWRSFAVEPYVDQDTANEGGVPSIAFTPEKGKDMS